MSRNSIDISSMLAFSSFIMNMLSVSYLYATVITTTPGGNAISNSNNSQTNSAAVDNKISNEPVPKPNGTLAQPAPAINIQTRGVQAPTSDPFEITAADRGMSYCHASSYLRDPKTTQAAGKTIVAVRQVDSTLNSIHQQTGGNGIFQGTSREEVSTAIAGPGADASSATATGSLAILQSMASASQKLSTDPQALQGILAKGSPKQAISAAQDYIWNEGVDRLLSQLGFQKSQIEEFKRECKGKFL